MNPRTFLRIEGATVLLLCLAGYLHIDGPIWLLLVLALAPDLSMVGYVAGPKTGSLVYNAVHTYTSPLTLGAAGVWLEAQPALLVAFIWAGHIGADRLIGYGLKFDTGFRDTHLSTQPIPIAAFSEEE